MEKRNIVKKKGGGGGTHSLAFTLACHPELASACWRACEPYKDGSTERVSGSKTLQQMLKPVQHDKTLGFTLAEVLITLAIIGVVAALTIPTVVRNYQKAQTVTQLKKTYSALANTTNLAIAEHGPIQDWEVGNRTRDFSNAFLKTYLAPYLKVAKICETENAGDCSCTINGLDKSSSIKNSAWTRFYLNDGTFICLLTYNYEDEGEMLKQVDIYVDINGKKAPNTWGKDVFSYVYYINRPGAPSRNGKFLPFGMYLTRSDLLQEGENACNKNGSGFFCGALIMRDGWQISDDYPW